MRSELRHQRLHERVPQLRVGGQQHRAEVDFPGERDPGFHVGSILLAQINAFNCATNDPTSAQEVAIKTACFGALVGSLSAGAACSTTMECSAGLFCQPTSIDAGTQGTCQPLHTAGQSCNEFGGNASSTDITRQAEFECSYRGSGSSGLLCHYADLSTGAPLPAGTWTCQSELGVDAGCNVNVDCQTQGCDPDQSADGSLPVHDDRAANLPVYLLHVALPGRRRHRLGRTASPC